MKKKKSVKWSLSGYIIHHYYGIIKYLNFVYYINVVIAFEVCLVEKPQCLKWNKHIINSNNNNNNKTKIEEDVTNPSLYYIIIFSKIKL